MEATNDGPGTPELRMPTICSMLCGISKLVSRVSPSASGLFLMIGRAQRQWPSCGVISWITTASVPGALC